MPGYSRLLIVNSNDKNLDKFVCAICHDILKNPVCTKCCGQTYCKECINSWLTGHDSCPNDRKKLTTSDLTSAPILIKELINELKIKCEKKECTEIVTIEELENHEKNCKAGLCKSCEFPLGENDHDCIKTLKIKISEMSLEISSLKEKSEVNIQRPTIKTLAEEAFRCNVNNYRILSEVGVNIKPEICIPDRPNSKFLEFPHSFEERELELNRRWRERFERFDRITVRDSLICKCQEALKNYRGEGVNLFAKNLSNDIGNLGGRGGQWNAVVCLFNYGQSLPRETQSLTIEFDDKIIIELFHDNKTKR